MGRASFNRLYARDMNCDTLTVTSTSYDLSVDGHFSSAIISTGYAVMSSFTGISTATFAAVTLTQSVLSSCLISTGSGTLSTLNIVSTGTIGTARLSSAVISTGTGVFSSLTCVDTFVYTPSTTTTSITFATSTMVLSGAASTKLSWGYQTMYLQRGMVVNFSTITSTYIITA